MHIDNVDVILRTRDFSKEIEERFTQNIRNIPTNNMIIETSSPLGIATMKALHKVETEYFVAFDDDVTIPDDWFMSVAQYMTKDVGAVDGHLRVKGLGKLDEPINKLQLSEPRTLKQGERAFGLWNTLGRKDVFTTWKPSRPDLSAWEDYELGMHVLKSGYKWITIPILNGFHYWSFDKVKSNSIWSAKGFKATHNGYLQLLNEIYKNVRWLEKMYRSKDQLRDYQILQSSSYLKGLLQRNNKKEIHKIQGSKMYYGERFSYMIKGLKESGYYEITKDNLSKYVSKNSICVDVGANIGYWTLMLSKLGKKVYSFEPDDYNFAILEMNCLMNKIHNVILHQKAVGEENHRVKLYHSNVCSGMHRIYQSKWCENESTSVPMVRLDDEIDDKIDFMKIDVEGSELGVFKGAIKSLGHKPIIFMEFDADSINEYGASPDKVKDFLKDYNITTRTQNNLLCIPKK